MHTWAISLKITGDRILRHKLCRHTCVSIMSKRISGKFCVAAGCGSTHRDNVSLHEFPKENRAEIRRLWINIVKTKRKDFTNTSKYSVLCEKHVTPECYPMKYSIKKAMGLEVKKKCLLPDAVATIHTVDTMPSRKRSSRSASPENTMRPSQPQKIRAAFRKRECMRVSCIKFISEMNFTEHIW